MDALTELASRIKAGELCFQEAGWGPFVWAEKRAKPFASRIARQGERLGLMSLDYCTHYNKWRWALTRKGEQHFANLTGNPTQEADK